MEAHIRPTLRAKYGPKGNGDSGDRRDLQMMKTMWLMVAVGLSIFLAGFGIWALDNQYCSVIRRWRHQVGLPWGILLEGHGWWHLMTGVGSYFYIVWGIWLRRCLNHEEEDFRLHWPSIFKSLPEVVSRDRASAPDEAPRRYTDKDRKSR